MSSMGNFISAFIGAAAVSIGVSSIYEDKMQVLADKQLDVMAAAKREITMKEKTTTINDSTVTYSVPDTTFTLTANDVRKMGFNPQ